MAHGAVCEGHERSCEREREREKEAGALVSAGAGAPLVPCGGEAGAVRDVDDGVALGVVQAPHAEALLLEEAQVLALYAMVGKSR